MIGRLYTNNSTRPYDNVMLHTIIVIGSIVKLIYATPLTQCVKKWFLWGHKHHVYVLNWFFLSFVLVSSNIHYSHHSVLIIMWWKLQDQAIYYYHSFIANVEIREIP